MMKVAKICVLIILLLISAIHVHAWPIPDTGQTKCYNNTAEIRCQAPGEPFYGQDGNYSINPPSYTKLDASSNTLPDSATTWTMVKDNVTGLIWENKTNDGSIHDGSKTFTWCDTNPATNGGNQGTCGTGTDVGATDTESFIKALNNAKYGGFSDWRMPNVKELISIEDLSKYSPAINITWFPNTVSSYYWSSTTYAVNSSSARYVNFDYGFVDYAYKTFAFAVRAVRGEQSGSLDHSVINGDGTVTDTATGLMWQQGTSSPAAITWEAALTYAAGLTLAGYDDWRLPTPKELQSIVEYSHYNPAINTTLFTGTVSTHYRTSTTSSDYGASAWCAYFDSGGSASNNKTNAFPVRAVRGGQVRSSGSLVISSPFQGEYWTVGQLKTITWDTAGISGNVKITLSRQGGKTTSFTETIADGVTNNGSYTWTVTGPASVNCVLKIEPLSDTTKGTTQGLFSIQTYGSSPSLIISKSGSGSGTVTSAPAGIDCGTTCSNSFNSGASVTLTATSDAGSTFTGWGGACTGAGTCQVTMDAVKSVTAAFADTSAGMVLIPAGSFQMGDAIDGDSTAMPVHTVTLSAFYLDKYEVTKALWDEVYSWATAHGYSFDSTGTGTAATSPAQPLYWYDAVKWLNARSEKEGRTPVYYTDAGQTTVYRIGKVDVAAGAVKWLANGYRLPTEAEWEYAARAGTTTRFYTGSCISDTQANYDGTPAYYGCSTGQNRGTSTAVGSFSANPWGLYDMAGNVWEWTWDWYGSYSSTAVTSPKGPDSGTYRVSRGGSWSNDMRSPRSVNRNWSPLTWLAGTNIGFRSTLSQQSSSFTLTLNKSGTGAGNVTSDSGAVTWTGSTGTVEYSTGSNVTLSAVPDAGSTFTGWSGDCSGTGTCSLAMLSGRIVTATFTLIPVDTTPPMGAAIVINGGAASTGATQVTLTLSASDAGSGMGQMKFSDNGTAWSTPASFSATASWTLTTGDGQKSVYALFSDKAGNWMTSPVSATILLQTQVAPANPSGLLVESTTNSAISLKWNKNSEAGAVYHVFRSQTDGGIFYQVNTLPVGEESLSFGKLMFTDRSLKEGTTYYYKTKAAAGGVSSVGFSNVVNAKTAVVEDYQVVAVDPTNIVNVGNAAKYYLQILPKDRFKGIINITCSGISSGLLYEFFVNGENKGASTSLTSLPASVVLQITAGSTTEVREHRFDVLTQNIWMGGSSDLRHTPLSLTVIAKNSAGIHTEIEKSILRKGEKVKIYGSILPPTTGKTVILTLTSGSGSPQTKNVTTTLGGKFEEGDWISTLPIGSYEIKAAFTDSGTVYTSESRPFVVEKGAVVLTCLRKTGEQGAIGSDFTIQGALKPAVPYTEITLRSIDPDGNVTYRPVNVDVDGQYLLREAYFNKNGIWKFRAYFAGNDDTIGTESDDLVVPVGIDIGRAIILGGGEAAQSNTYWDVTKKLTVAAYRDFKSKGYLKEMIYYLINSQTVDINYDDIPDDVVSVTTPTVAAFLDAIRTRYASVLDAQTPLFIYMQGHATQDKRFKILGTEEYLTSLQMKDALDKLQGVGAYQGQGGVESNIIVIIETCYSGNFIPDLSGPRRAIVTSAGNEPYNTDATGQISFSRRLFSKLLEGDSLKKAFDYARSAQVNMNYPAPRLDDNGDGTDNATDGLLASNIHLNGALTWGLKPVIGTGAVSLAAVIEGVASTPISVNVTKGDVNIERVWTQIIAPNANIGGGTETIAYPEIDLTLNTTTQRYEGTLTGLTISGIYKIVVQARDANKDVSDPALAYITVASPPLPGGDVNEDGYVTLADAVLAMQFAARITPPAGAIQQGYAPSTGDVNADGKIGLAEVIYILQKVAGMR